MADVKVTYYDSAQREFMSSADVREVFQYVGDRVAEHARQHAPVGRPSHGGAASIEAVTELGPDGWEVRIGPDRSHYYMSFTETGTVHMAARPFLVPALTETRV